MISCGVPFLYKLCAELARMSVVVVVVGRPLKPEITSVNSSSYDITVAWKQSSHCYEQFQFTHEVQWKKESETEWSHSTLQPPGTEHTISGLSAATSYNIRVRAVAVDPKSSDTTLYSHFVEQNIATSSGVLTASDPYMTCTCTHAFEL